MTTDEQRDELAKITTAQDMLRLVARIASLSEAVGAKSAATGDLQYSPELNGCWADLKTALAAGWQYVGEDQVVVSRADVDDAKQAFRVEVERYLGKEPT